MLLVYLFFFFKKKTAYEMRISDWSSDVCSSDLHGQRQAVAVVLQQRSRAVGAGVVDGDDLDRAGREIEAAQRLQRQAQRRRSVVRGQDYGDHSDTRGPPGCVIRAAGRRARRGPSPPSSSHWPSPPRPSFASSPPPPAPPP